MDKRWLLLLMVATFGDACSTDEGGLSDGGPDASIDGTSDAGAEASKDASPEADVTTNACDGGKTCGVPSDCPATATVCVLRTCGNGCCGTTVADAGAPCTEDGGVVCDGTGLCVACNQSADCKSNTTCMTPGCSGHTCSFTNTATGTFCNDDGGKVCDGTGNCVACNQPSDCPTQTTTCATNTCSTGTCGTNNTATGTFCNDNKGQVCDGIGACVQCNTTADCLFFSDAGTLVCIGNKCT